MNNLKSDLCHWNINVFGNIFKRKRRLINRLNGIERNLNGVANSFLEDLKTKLWREYEDIIFQEEILWYKKSRCKWLKFGDRNSKYFHGITMVRRKKNRIEALQNDRGEWINHSEGDHLENLVTDFFVNLYTAEGNHIPFCLSGAFPPLSPSAYACLAKMVTSEEIRSAVFSMGGCKAPGPDGMQAIFYQSNWGIVGDALSDFVKGIF
ncbi:uncharacterized protein LOC130736609 [Lotus japonicus]|uniref:uncharacterized protein LOC130736609 n=1 Tax=Lotus japonicus TaxID=34305 RepID=UPI00258E34F1|nr:uncharacterized protein LOC130736609 [Lotus japonicus]